MMRFSYQLLSAKPVVYLLNGSSRDYLRLLSTDNSGGDDSDDEKAATKVDSKNNISIVTKHRISSNKKLEAVRWDY